MLMAAPIVCLLCALVILKPQEFVPLLAGLPLLHVAFALSLFVGVVDASLGRNRLSLSPLVPLVFAFLGWGAIVTLVRNPAAFPGLAASLAVLAGIFCAIAFFTGTPSGLFQFGRTFLACAVFATCVALMQVDQPFVCMTAEKDDWSGRGELQPDGRPCEASIDCRKDAPDPDALYRCERPGPFGTSTVGGRIRYRGTLADPNELSLTAALALPFAVAMAEKKKDARGSSSSFWRFLFALAIFATVAVLVVLSKSRMGLLVFLVVSGLAFVLRAGPWAAVIAAISFPPLLLFGGRSGAEADASADERLDLLADALGMIKRSKGIGFGVGQFASESKSGMTAHNSYLLAAAETGIIGICLFALILYVAVKIPASLWLGDYDVDSRTRSFAAAIATSLVGVMVGIFFLSWSHQEILYMLLGASAALHQAAHAQDPRFRTKLGLREAALVSLAALALVPLVHFALTALG